MKIRLIILSIFLSSGLFAQEAQNFWSTTTLGQKNLKSEKKAVNTENLYSLDVEALSKYLTNAPGRSSKGNQSKLVMDFPNMKGDFESFYVVEASNFTQELQDKYPAIRSYRGVNVNNPTVRINFSISPNGVKTMRTETGATTIFIEPVSSDNSVYNVFEKTNKSGDWSCDTDDKTTSSLIKRFEEEATHKNADDQVLRDFRLALSCTAEYTQYFGGTVADALAAMNATMTRVNGVFENDFAIHLTMISNNTDLIYTDASTDPYSNPTTGMSADATYGGAPWYASTWNIELQQNLTNTIGNDAYDIGHLFGASGGGGNAGCIGCVCENPTSEEPQGKGSGFTSPNNAIPEGDSFDIDYVAHEMGHQLGANHTFSRSEGTGVNFEPGSGSTIMGYAGITGSATDVQAHSDDYFHYASISQVTTNVKTKTCPTETPIANNPPTADAGADYSVPISTPFILTGGGTDTDGDTLTYTWEEVDNSTSFSYVAADPTSTSTPLVRSIAPTTSPERYIPSFDKVLSGNLFSSFESLASVAREMKFALQVRDNNASGIGQTASDQMVVNIVGDTPFEITSPENGGSVSSGEPVEITWEVASTNQSPFNVSLVDIYLSTDQGENFTLVADDVTNDGAETINIPAGTDSEEGAYIMIKSVGNIFYTISKVYIGYKVTTQCYDYSTSSLPLNIADGTGANAYGAYSTATFTVPDIGTVDDVKASVDITHTYVGDLQVVLQSPDNTTVALWNRGCSSTSNLAATFTDSGTAVSCSAISGEIRPSSELSAYAGKASAGDWLLKVRDGYTGDTGTFNSATLTLCQSETEVLGTTDITGTDNGNINIYPNPSNGVFNISAELENQGVELTVYDMTGRLIYSDTDSQATGTYYKELNLGGVAVGVYILQIKNGDTLVSKKLIVK